MPLFGPKAAVSNNDAQVSAIIDLQGYEACELILVTGVLADSNATFAVLVEDGDDSGLSDKSAVADTFLLGTEAEASFTFSDDTECRKIGYIGGKRYVRMTVTPSGNTGNLFLGGIAVLGHARNAPTSNPPA